MKINDKVKKAIEAVVEYNWADELADFEDHIEDEDANRNHIFRSLVALDQFVVGHGKTPEDFVKEQQEETPTE